MTPLRPTCCRRRLGEWAFCTSATWRRENRSPRALACTLHSLVDKHHQTEACVSRAQTRVPVPRLHNPLYYTWARPSLGPVAQADSARAPAPTHFQNTPTVQPNTLKCLHHGHATPQCPDCKYLVSVYARRGAAQGIPMLSQLPGTTSAPELLALLGCPTGDRVQLQVCYASCIARCTPA